MNKSSKRENKAMEYYKNNYHKKRKNPQEEERAAARPFNTRYGAKKTISQMLDTDAVNLASKTSQRLLNKQDKRESGY